MEALPHGFGDFSITMDAPLPAIWPPQQGHDIHCHRHLESMEELAQKLAAAEEEQEEVLGEVRHKVGELAALKDFIRRMAEECNLFWQQHCQLLACTLAAPTPSRESNRNLLVSSSPFPVAVFDHSALFRQSSVAHGATVNGGRRAEAPVQLGTKRPLAIDHHSSALLEPSSVAHRAAKRPLAMDHQRSALLQPSSVAHSAAKRPLALDHHTSALLEPSSVARSAVKSPVPLEHSSAMVEPSSVAHTATNRPLALHYHSSTLLEPSPVAHSAPVDENRSAAEVAARALARLELQAAKRPLPEKGRLMQAVMDAGPLLQTLMVTGPLPKWRNPPPMKALTNAMIPAPSSSRAPTGLPRSTH